MYEKMVCEIQHVSHLRYTNDQIDLLVTFVRNSPRPPIAKAKIPTQI